MSECCFEELRVVYVSTFSPQCVICQKALLPAQRLMGLCSNVECQRRHLVNQGRETLRYRNLILRKRFHEVREQTAATAGVDHPERYPLVIVPSFVNGLVPLSEQRRQNFRANIAKIIQEAWDLPFDDLPEAMKSPRPEVQKFFGGACALCRGYCCRLGGDDAFFRPETVHRFRQTHPDLSQEQVIDVYMSHLQEQSLENSCVYHGERGCVLPRDIRPGICNDFFCEGLWDVVSDLNPEKLQGFFVQANGSYLAGAAFIEGEQTTKVEVRVGFVNMADREESYSVTPSS